MVVGKTPAILSHPLCELLVQEAPVCWKCRAPYREDGIKHKAGANPNTLHLYQKAWQEHKLFREPWHIIISKD